MTTLKDLLQDFASDVTNEDKFKEGFFSSHEEYVDSLIYHLISVICYQFIGED